MVNIKQITNFDQPTGDPITIDNIVYNYYALETGLGAFKIGYCTNDNEGMNYPIYLVFTTDPTQKVIFHIGKTGMFEYETVEWKDVNADPTEHSTSGDTGDIRIHGIWVAKPVPFCVDYCFNQS